MTGAGALVIGSGARGVAAIECGRDDSGAGGEDGFAAAGACTVGDGVGSCETGGAPLIKPKSRRDCAGVLGWVCDEGVATAHSRVKEPLAFASAAAFAWASASSRSFVRLLTSARISATGRRAATSSPNTRLTPS